MSLLRVVLEHFVQSPAGPGPAADEDFVPTDEGPDRACAEPAPRTSSGVAVLSPAADAHALGAAMGLVLAGRSRAYVVVVCVWTAGRAARPGWRAPATPGARRTAATLGARGHSCLLYTSPSPRD